VWVYNPDRIAKESDPVGDSAVRHEGASIS
jgi:hypothetical protein